MGFQKERNNHHVLDRYLELSRRVDLLGGDLYLSSTSTVKKMVSRLTRPGETGLRGSLGATGFKKARLTSKLRDAVGKAARLGERKRVQVKKRTQSPWQQLICLKRTEKGVKRGPGITGGETPSQKTKPKKQRQTVKSMGRHTATTC